MNPIIISTINYIINKTNEFNADKDIEKIVFLSANRIQRLLYLCQIEYVKKYNILMFEEEFRIWPSGPAIDFVYTILIDFWTQKVYPLIKEDFYKLKLEICEVIDDVLVKTNGIDTKDLEESVKSDGLWKKYCVESYPGLNDQHLQTIPNDEIIKYYKNNKPKTYFMQKR